MAMYGKTQTFQAGPKISAELRHGLRKRGSFKKGNGKKAYRGQGK